MTNKQSNESIRNISVYRRAGVVCNGVVFNVFMLLNVSFGHFQQDIL